MPVETGKGPLTITKLRFYISNLKLSKQGKPVWVEPGSYHLLDASDPTSLTLCLDCKNISFDTLTFNLGIDSVTNARGAQGGILDAANGMYWAWHSGYINLKLEGASPLCNTRKHQFQYHLGGFRVGENALQRVTLPVSKNQGIVVRVDVARFLDGIDLATEPTSMTPGRRSIELSQKAAEMFYVEAKP